MISIYGMLHTSTQGTPATRGSVLVVSQHKWEDNGPFCAAGAGRSREADDKGRRAAAATFDLDDAAAHRSHHKHAGPNGRRRSGNFPAAASSIPEQLRHPEPSGEGALERCDSALASLAQTMLVCRSARCPVTRRASLAH